MKAARINIDWRPDLSIYASEAFLKTAGDDYGWIGGFDAAGKLSCILPYTIINKATVRMARFRVETICANGPFDLDAEKSFLNGAIRCLRSLGADLVIPASTNTLFRTYPDGAVAAPYGSFIIDLETSEEALWSKVHSKHRNVIRNARNKGVRILSGLEYLDVTYNQVRDTFSRSKMSFMSRDAFERMVRGLGEQVKIFVAELNGSIQGSAVIPFSQHSAYYAYGGSLLPTPLTGATNLLQWEAIRCFHEMGVKHYDFCGARIDPEKGSKQAGLIMYKQRFGGRLAQGYMWKYCLNPLKARVYSLAVRLLRGGDIVDMERHKLKAPEKDVCAAA